MTQIMGISGSLRSGSFNTALLRVVAGMLPAGVELSVHTLHGVPPYDGDLESREGIPKAVTQLKEVLASSRGLLIATPEYNNSIPGVLKNAIDWMTRPPSDIGRVFHGRPVALMGATPGGFGTILSQNEWLPVLRYLQMKPWFGGRILLSNAQTAFDEKLQLTDDKVREQLSKFARDFVQFCENPTT